MKFCPLASSSKGNAYLVMDGRTRLLIECGLTHKKLQKLAGFSLSSLDGVLVSHEHKDHSGCVDKLLKDGIPCYMTEGTARALALPEVLLELAIAMKAGEQFRIGSMTILPFETFHDCEESVGFVVRSDIDGDILAFATDTVNLPYRFPGVTILAVEANYQKERLEALDRLPDKTKERIKHTHLEIETLCDCLRSMDLSNCREIHLLHLSDATSNEEHFINKISRLVPPNIKVFAACRGK